MTKFISKYVADQIENWIKGTSFPAPPSNTYLAAFTAAPTARDGTGGTEVSTAGTAYARQAIGSGSWGSTTTSGSGTTSVEQSTNTPTINYAQATANWGTIVGVGLYDAATGGNFLAYGDLSSSVVINTNDTLQVPATNLEFQV